MELGQDVELKIDYLNATGQVTGAHFVAVSGFSMAGNQSAVFFNDDGLQDGTANGLRINHLAKIESDGNFMKLGGEPRNRVVLLVAESPRTTFTLGYVVNVVANTISGFVQGVLGNLTSLTDFPIMAEGGPHSAAYSPAKGRLYVSDYFGNNVARYQVNPGAGSLTLEQTIPAGTDPISMVIANESGGQFLFVVNEGSNDLYEWDVNAPDGNMVPRGQFPLRGASRPQFIVAPADGKNVYIGSCGNPSCNGPGTINIFAVDSNGNASEISASPVAAGMGTVWLHFDATDKRLFTADQGSGTITEFVRNSATGELTRQATFPVGPGISSVVVDPSNRVAIATLLPVNAGLVFRYDSTTGNLTEASTFSTGMFPVSGNFDPRGVNYYVANVQDGSISGYTVDYNAATVMPVPGSPFPTGFGSFFDVFFDLPGSQLSPAP
jgi:DNA-binding beta-propeller fold protein YncE